MATDLVNAVLGGLSAPAPLWLIVLYGLVLILYIRGDK